MDVEGARLVHLVVCFVNFFVNIVIIHSISKAQHGTGAGPNLAEFCRTG